MHRPFFELEDELVSLRELTDTLPELTDDGDSNRDAVDAQIRVIEGQLTQDEIYELYEEDDFILKAALGAESWLRNDDIAPSEQWNETLAAIA